MKPTVILRHRLVMIVLSNYFKGMVISMLLSTIMLVPLATSGQSVTQTIEVNESGDFKKSLPFDECFRVKLDGQSSRYVHNAFLYYYEGGQLRQISTENTGNRLTKYYAGKSLFLEVPALDPQKHIAISIIYKPHGDRLKTLLDINSLILEGNLAEAQSKYDSLDLKSLTTVGKAHLTFTIYGWNSYNSYFQTTLDPIYASLDVSTITSGTYNSFNKANFDDIVGKFSSNGISSTQLMTLAIINESSNLKMLETGSIEFADFSVVSGLDDITSRIKNLEHTQNQLNTILAQLNRLLFHIPGESTAVALKADVQDLSNRIQVSIQKHQEGMKMVEEEIRNNKNLYYASFYFGTNNFSDLKTEYTYKIIPTVGVLFVPAFGREEFDLLTLTYAGATIYFRPVNKNLGPNCECYKWGFRQRFSLNLGVTVNSIESDEFEDFYKGTSLLIGGNYKFNRIISATFGGVIMKQKNENPLLDDPHTVVRPYGGISLDLDIANLFGSVKTKLF